MSVITIIMNGKDATDKYHDFEITGKKGIGRKMYLRSCITIPIIIGNIEITFGRY